MDQRPKLVVSYGMGTDSTALLLRWLLDRALRPADPRDWLVITSMTGNEWPSTIDLVAEHVLPLLTAHGVRFVQVARGGRTEADGIVVLDDSRAPQALYPRGPWTLLDELLAGGTVPQVTGNRKCSIKFKGSVIDRFVASDLSGPYQHVIGYESGEARRAVKDAAHNTAARTGLYPLIQWGWDRLACERYIEAQLGVTWQKSACTFCPFALCNKEGLLRTLDRYADDPRSGVEALVLEELAVGLNPRQGLANGERLSALMAGDRRLLPVLRLFEERLAEMTWNLYEVRRASRKPRSGHRELQVLGSGSQDQMLAGLRDRYLKADGQRPGAWEWSAHDGIDRVWIRRRGDGYPYAEHYLVAAPAGAAAKTGPGFADAWKEALAGQASGLW